MQPPITFSIIETMNLQNFEAQLLEMSKPDVAELKHQEMLANAITSAKDKSVLSGWWLSIPLYLVAALLMKTYFMPQTTLPDNLHEFTHAHRYIAALLFLVLPIVFIGVSSISIKRIYFLMGNANKLRFLQSVWHQILVILLSLLLIIVVIV